MKNVPEIVVEKTAKSAAAYSHSRKYSFHYEMKEHTELPHVVKFSGGRSSAMLLFILLKNKLLKAERGDVIVFNNTSAEHPETYRFAAKCKEEVEQNYNIPFFWIEFQTYEDAKGGEWVRSPAYRLVKSKPWSSQEPDGYHWNGKVYEEMLSWSGFVPNQFQRTCTQKLKLETTRAFLKDWFACKEKIERLGHYGDESRMDGDAMYENHQKHHGKTPKDVFLRKKSYVQSCQTFRPEQAFSDFASSTDLIDNPRLENMRRGNSAYFGDSGVEYASFIGLRYDEMHRVVKVRRRNSGGPESDGYEGEHVYMPLATINVTKGDVNDFWQHQKWNLNLPEGNALSNCVYCFLKGAKNLGLVQQHMHKSDKITAESPCDIKWWERMEKFYGRDLNEENRETKGQVKNDFIGFFGTQSGFSYRILAKSNNEGGDISRFSDTVLPCDCTD